MWIDTYSWGGCSGYYPSVSWPHTDRTQLFPRSWCGADADDLIHLGPQGGKGWAHWDLAVGGPNVFIPDSDGFERVWYMNCSFC